MDILQACDLKKTYGTGEACVHALDGVSLNVEKGEFVAIVGTSGSGKSTLLHMLGGLDRPSSGKVFVDGKDIFSLKDEELTIFRRRKIGFVFQAYNLVPVLNVYENIVLPIELDGGKVDKEFAVLQSVGMTKRQLKLMLIYEGLFYAVGSIIASLILSVVLSPMLGNMMSAMFWFVTYHFTIMPVILIIPVFLLLGWLIPAVLYHAGKRQSIVENLREL